MPVGRGCCVATLPLKIPTEMDVSLPQFTLHKFTLCGRWSLHGLAPLTTHFTGGETEAGGLAQGH